MTFEPEIGKDWRFNPSRLRTSFILQRANVILLGGALVAVTVLLFPAGFSPYIPLPVKLVFFGGAIVLSFVALRLLLRDWRGAPRRCLLDREPLSPQEVYDGYFREDGVRPAVFMKAMGLFEEVTRLPLSKIRPTDPWPVCVQVGRQLVDPGDLADLEMRVVDLEEAFQHKIPGDTAPKMENLRELVLYFDRVERERGDDAVVLEEMAP